MPNFAKKIDSPVGELTLVCNGRALIAVIWEDDENRLKLKDFEIAEHPVLTAAAKQLKEYFAGRRREFDLPIEFIGTDFQKKVWQALRKIPFGRTFSYGELAAKIGSPKASRAVGSANRMNPVSIIVPCHRVIGAGGQLTGFAGGLAAKKLLLDLESTAPSPKEP